jgi:RHS repeat-associated protein
VDSDSDGVADAGETVIARYEYDALNRRTKEFINADTDDDFDSFRHFYYTEGWQLLETRLATGEDEDHPETLQPEYQYVWSLRYMDAPVLRDENKDADDDCTESGTDERLYYANDANMNVTALVGTDGTPLERYVYDPYGKVTIYDGTWTNTRNSSSYDNSILFCGYYLDWETGLYHVRNRYYHPYFGLITRDPGGYSDGMSLYEYCRSGPLGALDAMGLGLIEPGDPGWDQAEYPSFVPEPGLTLPPDPNTSVPCPTAVEGDEPPPQEQPPVGPVAPDPQPGNVGGVPPGGGGYSWKTGVKDYTHTNPLAEENPSYADLYSEAAVERMVIVALLRQQIEKDALTKPIAMLGRGPLDTFTNTYIAIMKEGHSSDAKALGLAAIVTVESLLGGTRYYTAGTGQNPEAVMSAAAWGGPTPPRVEGWDKVKHLVVGGLQHLGAAALTAAAVDALAPAAATNSIVGRGPANLAEQIMMKDAQSGGGDVIMRGPFGDPLYSEPGWVKMQNLHSLPGGGNINVHYMQNTITGEMSQFKFINP